MFDQMRRCLVIQVLIYDQALPIQQSFAGPGKLKQLRKLSWDDLKTAL